MVHIPAHHARTSNLETANLQLSESSAARSVPWSRLSVRRDANLDAWRRRAEAYEARHRILVPTQHLAL